MSIKLKSKYEMQDSKINIFKVLLYPISIIVSVLFLIKVQEQINFLYGFLLYWFSAITLYVLLCSSTIIHSDMVIDAWYMFKKEVVTKTSFKLFTVFYVSLLVSAVWIKLLIIVFFAFYVIYFFYTIITLDSSNDSYEAKTKKDCLKTEACILLKMILAMKY